MPKGEANAKGRSSLQFINPLRLQSQSVEMVVVAGMVNGHDGDVINLWLGWMKCLATGLSLLCLVSAQCSRRRVLRSHFFSPTYC